MIKNAFIFILLFTLLIGLVGCEDDDFAPFTHYEKSLDQMISNYPSSIDDITNEMTKIANNYEDGIKLTNVIIEFVGTNQINEKKGNILFDFYKEHQTKNQITRVMLNYNMSTSKVDSVEYIQGHGKRVGGYPMPINQELSKVSIAQLISELYKDREFQEKIKLLSTPKLEIDFTKEINIRLYNNGNNQGPIYRKKIITLPYK